MLTFLIGITLLTFGRKLFWLLVAAVGFVLGNQFAQAFFLPESYWTIFIVGLLGGAAGALLGIFLQKVAIGIAGFAAGYAISCYIMMLPGWTPEPLLCGFGGVLSAILLYWLFDWWLIILSAILGAQLILQYVNWTPPHELGLYIGMIITGIVFQSIFLGPKRGGYGRRSSSNDTSGADGRS